MIEWNRLEFSQPEFFFLLCLLPVVYWLAGQSQGRVVFSSLKLIPKHSVSKRQRFLWLPSLCFTLGMGFLILASTGPRVGNKQMQIKKEGISIMMVVDTSSSMRALDLAEDDESNRLDIVKQLFSSFVRGTDGFFGRQNDAIGLVRFAGFADTSCPISLDHSSLLSIVSSLDIVQSREEDGTAIGDALALAISRIQESSTSSKIVVLLTDGENNAGEESPLVAADLAASQGVKIYTIGVGSEGMAPVPMVDPRTGQQQLRAMRVSIDEQLLQEIAKRSSGRYFRATDQESLKEIIQEIDRLEKTVIEETRYRQYTEYFAFLSGGGLFFLCLALLLDSTVFRRFP